MSRQEKLTPEETRMWDELLYYLLTKNPALAVRTAKDVISVSGAYRNFYVYNGLGMIYTGNRKGAVETWEKAKYLYPQDGLLTSLINSVKRYGKLPAEIYIE